MEKIIEKIFDKIPLLKGNTTLQHLAKYILSAFAIYMLLKAPIMLVLTDLWGVHYIWSGFIAGVIITLISFIPFEFWAFKIKEGSKSTEK